MKPSACSRVLRATLLCVTVVPLIGAFAGCEEPLEFGLVSGTLTVGEKPLNEVMVQFMPEPTAVSRGAHSSAITDSQGKYTLHYSLDPDIPGAVVGKHRVVVQDIAAENARDLRRQIRIRIHGSYSTAGQTPLKVEVVPGEQTFDFDLRGRK